MKIWALICLALLASACTQAPVRLAVENPERVWQARQTQLLLLSNWDVRGRLALRTANDGGQAAFQWLRQAQVDRIDLRGPLGRGLVRLQQDASGAQLQDMDQNIYRAENAELLLYRTTGWRLPVSSLPYWIRGLPTPGEPSETQLDDYGRLKTLRQSGWEVHFQEYQRTGDYELPVRFTLVMLQLEGSDPDVRVEARFIIEHWAFL